MEPVNKPFTMEEYDKIQYDKYLVRIKNLKKEGQFFSVYGLIKSGFYEQLEEITLGLLEKAYGNNNT